MIDIYELRIGNILQDKGDYSAELNLLRVFDLSFNEIKLKPANEHFNEPILIKKLSNENLFFVPINDETLNIMGLYMKGDRIYILDKKLYFERQNERLFFVGPEFSRSIQFLHTAQNIFYFLQGFELHMKIGDATQNWRNRVKLLLEEYLNQGVEGSSEEENLTFEELIHQLLFEKFLPFKFFVEFSLWCAKEQWKLIGLEIPSQWLDKIDTLTCYVNNKPLEDLSLRCAWSAFGEMFGIKGEWYDEFEEPVINSVKIARTSIGQYLNNSENRYNAEIIFIKKLLQIISQSF